MKHAFLYFQKRTGFIRIVFVLSHMPRAAKSGGQHSSLASPSVPCPELLFPLFLPPFLTAIASAGRSHNRLSKSRFDHQDRLPQAGGLVKRKVLATKWQARSPHDIISMCSSFTRSPDYPITSFVP
jgi:hypothetical protein